MDELLAIIRSIVEVRAKNTPGKAALATIRRVGVHSQKSTKDACLSQLPEEEDIESLSEQKKKERIYGGRGRSKNYVRGLR